MQACFCKVAGINGKKFLPEIFLNYQKRISPMDVFIILQVSANDFWVRAKGGKQQHYKNPSRSDVLVLLTLVGADAKSAGFFRAPLVTKAELHNFPLLHFPRWLCLLHDQLAMSL